MELNLERFFCAVSGFLGAAGDSFFSQNFWFGSHSVRLR